MLQKDGPTRRISAYRVSETAQQKWFSDELMAAVAGIKSRFEEMFELEVEKLKFAIHDLPGRGSFTIIWTRDAGKRIAGDCVLTLLIYLIIPFSCAPVHREQK